MRGHGEILSVAGDTLHNMRPRDLWAPLTLLLLARPVAAGEGDHTYLPGDSIALYFNKVGPYHNPQETYEYFTLPFCTSGAALAPSAEGGGPATKYAGLGEVLEGHGFVHSGMSVHFATPQIAQKLCQVVLTEEESEVFKHAVLHHYWYQMYLDDLPVWGMVGEIYEHPTLGKATEDGEAGTTADGADAAAASTASSSPFKLYIYTHKRISIGYNGNRVIEVNLTSQDPKLIEVGATLDFSYDVLWQETTKPFDSRFERYLDYSFFEHQIHWFSIFNSFMMVIFLVGIVAIILVRTLRNDYAKYMRDEEDLDETERGVGEESGWKQVHGDVFRSPPRLKAFAALYGAGHQLIALGLILIFLSIVSTLYMHRGAMVTTFIVCYGVTSAWSGYMSGSFYKQHFYPRPSPGWIPTMCLTASIFPVASLGVLFSLNTISLSYGTRSIPTTAAISLVLLWMFVAVPLTVGGTLLGRHLAPSASWPCRVHAIPGLVPEPPWFRSRLAIVLASGLLPFGSIFIEMWFIFTSFWNYKFYYVYGFMLLVYAMLSIVTVCVTIVAICKFLEMDVFAR